MSELIGGEEAIIAVYRGEQDVQYRAKGFSAWVDYDEDNHFDIEDFQNEYLEFRKKPKTTSVTLELPESFQPKIGEKYWYVTTNQNCGYNHSNWDGCIDDERVAQFGAYRTEENVIKARDAFRQLKAK